MAGRFVAFIFCHRVASGSPGTFGIFGVRLGVHPYGWALSNIVWEVVGSYGPRIYWACSFRKNLSRQYPPPGLTGATMLRRMAGWCTPGGRVAFRPPLLRGIDGRGNEESGMATTTKLTATD